MKKNQPTKHKDENEEVAKIEEEEIEGDDGDLDGEEEEGDFGEEEEEAEEQNF